MKKMKSCISFAVFNLSALQHHWAQNAEPLNAFLFCGHLPRELPSPQSLPQIGEFVVEKRTRMCTGADERGG